MSTDRKLRDLQYAARKFVQEIKTELKRVDPDFCELETIIGDLDRAVRDSEAV